MSKLGIFAKWSDAILWLIMSLWQDKLWNRKFGSRIVRNSHFTIHQYLALKVLGSQINLRPHFTHTHTHTHTNTHTHTHKHAHTQTYKFIHIDTHAHTHTQTYTFIHIDTHTHIHTRRKHTHTNINAQKHAHTGENMGRGKIVKMIGAWKKDYRGNRKTI